MKVCVVGAGAIGTFLGVHLAKSGCEVSALARGRTLSNFFRIHSAFATLSADIGPDPGSWTWGTIHTRVLDNLAQIPGLRVLQALGPQARVRPAAVRPRTATTLKNPLPSWKVRSKFSGA